MARAKSSKPPIVVLYGDEPYQKSRALDEVLARLIPPEADRALCLADYDGTRPEDQGGPSWPAIHDDLRTLPFLAERRVVLVRDADKFISAARQKLEEYLDSPAPTATLILVCKTFPKTTRLYKAADGLGGELIECRKPSGRALTQFVLDEVAARVKRIEPAAAARLVDRIGPEMGLLVGEIEKLVLYAADRATITGRDVDELVGLSREEKVFAVMDAAALGDAPQALSLWRQVLASDRDAIYRAVGGIAYMLRRYLAAHRLVGEGMPPRAAAPKVMMWGRENELEQILRRLPAPRVRRALAGLAEIDAQAKVGQRSIESGVEAILVEVARNA